MLRILPKATSLQSNRLFHSSTIFKNSFEESLIKVENKQSVESQPKPIESEAEKKISDKSIEIIDSTASTSKLPINLSTQSSDEQLSQQAAAINKDSPKNIPNRRLVKGRTNPRNINSKKPFSSFMNSSYHEPKGKKIVREKIVELSAAKIAENIAGLKMPFQELPHIQKNNERILRAEQHQKLLAEHQVIAASIPRPSEQEALIIKAAKFSRFKATEIKSQLDKKLEKLKVKGIATSKASAKVDPPPSRTPTLSAVETDRLANTKARQPYSSSPSSTTHSFKSPSLNSYSNILSSTTTTFESVIPPLQPNQTSQPKIATLSHSLDRVLFNEGIHSLRDSHTKVYNFAPEIELLPKVETFEFEKLNKYITSSEDEILGQVLKREGGERWVGGSTSSVTGMLCQIYFWMSKGKEVNISMLSSQWEPFTKGFSVGQRLPVSVVLVEKDGKYLIDSDKSMDNAGESILSSLGHLMEKLLTTGSEEFKGFLKGAEKPAESLATEPQAYHYTKTPKMILRSQLDAHSPHLPNGSFDVKTRGVVAIRQDRLNFEEAAGYLIKTKQGLIESYEKEFYDLIRSAFLKYSFQAKIGMMDGIFLCYHNCSRIFGFEYLKISKLDESLFGSGMEGEMVYGLTVGVLEKVLETGRDCYPGRSIKLMFEAMDEELLVFVEPLVLVEEDVPIKLLTLTGNNFVDSKSVAQVNILKTHQATKEIVDWTIGYDIVKEDETGQLNRGQISEKFYQTKARQLLFDTVYLPAKINAKAVAAAHLFIAENPTAENPTALSSPTGPSSLPAVRVPTVTAEELATSAALATQYPPLKGIRYTSKVHAGLNRIRAQSRAGAVEIKAQLAEDEKNGKVLVWDGSKVVERAFPLVVGSYSVAVEESKTE